MFSNVALAASVSVTSVKQDKDNWCWAACAEMAGKSVYSGTSYRTQYSVVNKIKGTAADPYPDVSGSISDSATGAKYVTYDTVDFESKSSKWSFSEIETSLTNGHAVQAGAGYYNWIFRDGGHVVVIYATTTDAAGTEYISYIDPWDGKSYTCTYKAFCDGSFNNRKYDQTIYVK